MERVDGIGDSGSERVSSRKARRVVDMKHGIGPAQHG